MRKLFGDNGYISADLFKQLFKTDLKLFTSSKQNMKNRLLTLIDKILLRKRPILETVNDQLKNIYQIVHSRHRNITIFMVNLVAGLIAFTHQAKKPSLQIKRTDLEQFPDVSAF